ncbi:MAG: DUF6683 family protein [Sphingomonadaceae bacterium]
MPLTLRLIVAIAAIVVSTTGAHAQMLAPDMAMGNLHNELLQRRLEDEAAGGAAKTTRDRPVKSAIKTQDLTFTPSKDVRRRISQEFIARAGQISPGAAADIRAMFASQPDFTGSAGQIMRSHGLDPHNMADAYALWWINVWSAANAYYDTPPSTTINAVKQQARSAFLAVPEFGTMSDTQKQEFTEVHIIQGVILDAAMQNARGDATKEKLVAKNARNIAKSSGLNLAGMTLTQRGFVRH